MTKRNSLLTVTTVLAGVVGCLGTWVIHGQVNPPPRFKALSYEVVTRQVVDGSLVETHREVHAQRSDGSRVVASQIREADGTVVDLRRIDDLHALTRRMVRSGTASVTTMALPSGTRDWMLAESRKCAGDTSAERSELRGYAVVREVVGTGSAGDAANTTSAERWLAPELDCLALDTTVVEGGKMLASLQVVNVRLGDPDPRLFAIPAGYSEMSPMDVFRLRQEMGSDQHFNPNGLFEAALEDAYARNRPR